MQKLKKLYSSPGSPRAGNEFLVLFVKKPLYRQFIVCMQNIHWKACTSTKNHVKPATITQNQPQPPKPRHNMPKLPTTSQHHLKLTKLTHKYFKFQIQIFHNWFFNVNETFLLGSDRLRKGKKINILIYTRFVGISQNIFVVGEENVMFRENAFTSLSKN